MAPLLFILLAFYIIRKLRAIVASILHLAKALKVIRKQTISPVLYSDNQKPLSTF